MPATSTFTRSVYLPLQFLIWACAVSTMGLSAYLVSEYGAHFPDGNLGSRTRLICFTGTWETIFSMYCIIGTFVAPNSELFSNMVQFIFTFIGFILSLVSSISITITLRAYSCSSAAFADCTIFTAMQAMVWLVCWFTFFAIFSNAWIGKDETARKERELLEEKRHQNENRA